MTDRLPAPPNPRSGAKRELPIAVIAALKDFACRHPQSAGWISAYLRSRRLNANLLRTIGGFEHGQLWRVVFADPERFPKADGLADYRLRTFADFLLNHPREPLRPGMGRSPIREDFPRCLRHALNLTRAEPIPLVQELGVLPLYRASLGKAPFASHVAPAWSQGDVEILRPVFESVLLTRLQVERVLNRPLRIYFSHFYFTTGAELLNLRNLFLFLDVLLSHNPRGGHIQNKIPPALSLTLGIRAHSIPELRMAADLIALAAHGLLNTQHLPATRLSRLLRQVAKQPPWRDLQDLARGLMSHSLVNPMTAKQVQARRGRFSVYWTGLLFNTQRLITGGPNTVLFRRFGRYYACVDRRRLRRLLVNYTRMFAEPMRARVRRTQILLRPAAHTAIGERDLQNALVFLVTCRPENPAVELPPVALYSFGMSETKIRSSRKHRFAPRVHKPTHRRATTRKAPPALYFASMMLQSGAATRFSQAE